MKSIPSDVTYRNFLLPVAENDVKEVTEKDRQYGASWKRRGGIGAFMMLARKFDRLEVQVAKFGYDIFAAMEAEQKSIETGNPPSESIVDTLRDARRYGLLIEADMVACNNVLLPGIKVGNFGYTETEKDSGDFSIDNNPDLTVNRNRIIKSNASELFGALHDYAKALSYITTISKEDIIEALIRVNNNRTGVRALRGDILGIVGSIRGE